MARAPALPVALTVGGSDPSGGAGIQADLKTFQAFGVYGEAVLVALTAQNTEGVSGVHEVPAPFVVRQLEAVLDDIPPAAAKTGMLSTAAVVEAVAGVLERRGPRALVVDPVIVSTSGDRLLREDAVEALRTRLLRLATIVTPNLPEARVLTGVRVRDEGSALEAGARILRMGAHAVLVKGGHGSGTDSVDWFVDGTGFASVLSLPRLRTRHTHGTGCTLSAAIAAGLARGRPLFEAVRAAKEFVHRALEAAPGLGAGRGPINHLLRPRAPRR